MSSRLPEPLESPEHRQKEITKFAVIVGLILTFLAAAPVLAGLVAHGGLYLQQQTALDDQMVYLAWMKQAAEGRFFFTNLFAIDPQPGLTFHLYFLLLGFVSKALGGPLTLTVARLGFTFLFVQVLGRLLLRLDFSVLQAKIGLVLGCCGAGLGWLGWEMFGRLILKGSPVAPLTNGRLSIDVWQPEAFVLPSMLTNGLFMASLCLFAVIFMCALEARNSWKPVLPGALCFLVLMNIHSYDVLLLALVCAGLAAVLAGSQQATPAWASRVAVMGLGSLPSAAWFIYVLQRDTVFQHRAATLTYSPTMAQIFVGILPLAVPAFVGLWLSRSESDRRVYGAGGLTVLVAALWMLGLKHNPDSYFMSPMGFGVALVFALCCLYLLQIEKPGLALLWAWAIIGVVALGFPALFQRKLGMGLSLPWGLLAAWYVADWVRELEGSKRLAALAAGGLAACASSILWVQREGILLKLNVSSTTTHAPVLTDEQAKILEKLETEKGPLVAIAMPGASLPDQSSPGSFSSPYIPDLNPMIAGISGKTAFAGHWSETPDYEKRRGMATGFFLAQTDAAKRAEIIKASGAKFAIAPVPEAFPQAPLAQPESLGKVVVDGKAWKLVELSL